MVFSAGAGEGESRGRRSNIRRKSPSPHTKAKIMSIAQVVELGVSHEESTFQKREKILHLNGTVALRELKPESSLWELAVGPRPAPQSSCHPVTKGS